MTTICASTQLARALVREDTSARMAAGNAVWETPDILSWSAWLRRQWDTLTMAPTAGLPVLLNSSQEQLLWEEIVTFSPRSAHVIDPSASARLAAAAYAIAAAYRIPAQHALWTTTDDAAAFAQWMRAFERRCERDQWLPAARLADRLPTDKPTMVELAGFETLTPQQEALLASSSVLHRLVPAAGEQRTALSFPDAASELDAAARWAARHLQADPHSHLAILDFQLAQNRATWEEALGRHCTGRFTVSPGAPLDAQPLPASALRLLELAAAGETASVHLAGAMLLSPFVKGYETERYARARADARLRQRSGPDVRLTEAIRFDDCPQMARVVRALTTARQELSEPRLPSAWAAEFHKLLRDGAGWPGDARLSANEYPVYEAWRDCLSDFAALDPIAGPKGFGEALRLLRTTVGQTLYQTVSGAGVTVESPESVYGARFDALWLASAHDAAWPYAPQPNPFIPIALQRQFGVPAATPAQAVARARPLTLAWLEAAPDITVSFARMGGQSAPQAISPLFANLAITDEQAISVTMPEGALESLADEYGPPAAPGAYPGGARLFKLQAGCAFRGFAEIRLNAGPLEEPYLGCSPRDHGSVIHLALEHCWHELGGSEGLRALSHAALEQLIHRSISQALTAKWPGTTTIYERLREVEQERLCRLLELWFTVERQRETPFTVLDMETKRTVSLRGVEVEIRADRVDELAGGQGIVILDYKTGKAVSPDWIGERPGEPQLPLYAATATRHVAGVALAQVHPKARKFVGNTESKSALPGKQPTLKPGTVAEWKATLEALADEFLSGKAELMPDKETCKFCHLGSFCRRRDASDEATDGD
jgi:ATP-dependent helicase/nuclease subunit B